MNISTLILAAEYLEKREKEAEHGYALSTLAPAVTRNRKPRSNKTKAARSTHNELEKNRRAHLRHCFDELRRVVPLLSDSSRHTTLGLLKRACLVIKEMKEHYKQKQYCLRELIREHHQLKRQQKHLEDCDIYYRGGHTISESSTCSLSSSGSSGSSERGDTQNGLSEDEESYYVAANFNHSLSISVR